MSDTGSAEVARSSDLEQAVEGFRRAEAALAEITADARALEQAGAEAAEARGALVAAGQDLKVVAGALVGLASAHQELVAQLGSAAAALRAPQRVDRELAAAPDDLQAVDPAVIVRGVDGATGKRLDELERRLVASQRRIYELVLVEGLLFCVLAALFAFVAVR